MNRREFFTSLGLGVFAAKLIPTLPAAVPEQGSALASLIATSINTPTEPFDIALRTWKYGLIEAFDRELFDDDYDDRVTVVIKNANQTWREKLDASR
jgi:hypothetical protein